MADKKTIKIKFFPKCRSNNVIRDIYYFGNGNWRCLKCGFTFQEFPEKSISNRQLKTVKDKTWQLK
ncbi:MAG: hypothetical protein AABX30_00315 [Nanoarchaeota archaeon]